MTAALPVPKFEELCTARGPLTPAGGRYMCTKRGCDGNHEAEGDFGEVVERWTDSPGGSRADSPLLGLARKCACETCEQLGDEGCPNAPEPGRDTCTDCHAAACAELADDAEEERHA